MAGTDRPDDDALLRRLNETATGDVAFRQMRQRYDTLRQDYLELLDRLEQVEAQVEPPPARPTLADQIAAPLLALREEYAHAAETLGTILNGLDRLSRTTLRGQHAATPPAEPEASVQVDVRARDIGTMLDFRHALEAVPGVRRVTITAADAERTTFLVDL